MASPREVALRLLEARFGPPPADSPGGRDQARPVFDLADFQRDAVRRASRILERRRGVVIADSVGLGKTYVALALAEQELRHGGRVLVVAPAALRRDWVPALRRLADGLGVARTSGLGTWRRAWDSLLTDGPSDGCPDPPRAAAPFLAWVSHARLSRGTHGPERLWPLDLVVVDEAHAFRSPGTRRYRALAALCRGARVVLLTATPVNNSVSDLYFQLRLFAGDGDFRDVGVADLGAAFRAAAADATAARGVTAVLREVMIRRTRPFLREHYAGVRLPGRGGNARVLTFPERAPPRPVWYSLEAAYPGLLEHIVDVLASLTLAPYAPGRYGSDPDREAGGVAELLRLALLKRLESSVAAFRASVARLIRYYEACEDALAAGRVLAPAEHRQLLVPEGGDDDVVQLVLAELALRPAPADLDVARLRSDVRSDLDALRGVQRALAEVDAASDPKLARLVELLEGEARGEKVVVFTEFRDTARHLWRALVRRGGVALVDGGGAFLGAGACGRRQAIERFAPRSNGAREPAARERVDLLIATDVLSEGLNLQDANRVVSYDLPWNPVRLIQRVGRVDRLGSPHAVVYAYHFLPDRGLEPLLGLVARLRAKLHAIGRTVGFEAAVLGADSAAGLGDLGSFVDRLAAGDPAVLEEAERRDAAVFEVEERLRAAYAVAWRELRKAGGGGGDLSAPRLHPGVRPASAPPPGWGEVPGTAGGGGGGPATLPLRPGEGEGAAGKLRAGESAAGGRAGGADPPLAPPAPLAREARLPVAARIVGGPGSGRGSRVLLGYRLGGEAVWVVANPARGTAAVDDVAAAELLLEALRPGDPEPARAVSAEQAQRGGRGGGAGARMRGPSRASPVSRRRRGDRVLADAHSPDAPDPPAMPDPGVIACALAVARPVLAARRVAGVGGVGARPRSAAAQAARRLQALLAAVPGGPDADMCARADAVLDALGRSLDAGTEAALRATLAGPGRAAPAGDGGGAAARALALLVALEGVVGLRPGAGSSGGPSPANGGARRRRARTGTASAAPLLIGILEFAAADG